MQTETNHADRLLALLQILRIVHFVASDSQVRDKGGKPMVLTPEVILVWLVVGAVAGWLAGVVMQGSGYGLVGDIVIGILGAIVAGYLFPTLGLHLGSGIVASIIAAAIGAIILLFVTRLVRRIA